MGIVHTLPKQVLQIHANIGQKHQDMPWALMSLVGFSHMVPFCEAL